MSNRVIVRRAVGLALGGLTLAPCLCQATDGYFSLGWGTKQKGLAGGGIALPQDALIVANNPAGLSWVGRRFDIAAELFSPHRRFEAGTAVGPGAFAPGIVTSDLEYFLIPSMAASWTQKDGSALGLAIYGNGGMSTSYPTSANGGVGVFGGGKTGVNMSQLFISGTYARKIASTVSVGVSAIFAHQTFEAFGLDAFNGYVPHPAPYHLSDKSIDSSDGFGIRAGVQAQLTPQVAFGAAYQPKIKMSKFHRYSDLFADHGNFDIPENYSAGLAIKTSATNDLTLDVRHIRYSDIPSVGNSMNNLPNGMGNPNGPGFGWRDMTIYKVGYQFQVDDKWTGRCGVSYGRQPVPSSEVLFNVLAPGVQEWHFTLGATKKIGDKGEFNIAFIYSPTKKVTGVNGFNPTQSLSIEMQQLNLEIGFSKRF